MARKSTLKVNKIEKKKDPVYKYMVVLGSETVTITANEMNVTSDNFLEFYLSDNCIAVFKDWKYFLRLDAEKTSSLTAQDYDGQPA